MTHTRTRVAVGLTAVAALSLSLAAPAASLSTGNDHGWHGKPQTLPKLAVMTGGGGRSRRSTATRARWASTS